MWLNPVQPMGSTSEFLKVLTVVVLVEQSLVMMREFPMLETMGGLVCPMCTDGYFKEAECF